MQHKRYAVLGNPIGHSLSPYIHQIFAQQCGLVCDYLKILVPIDRFERTLRDFFVTSGAGANITAPFKQRAFAMCDQVTERCRLSQAANTLWFSQQQLWGDNTDGIGLLRDLQRRFTITDRRILVLGAGGVVAAITPALISMQPMQLTIASRKFAQAKQLAKVYSTDQLNITAATLADVRGAYDLWIVAIPVWSRNPVLFQCLRRLLERTQHQPFIYDLNYVETGQTPIVAWASAHGCAAVDGLGMLWQQAAEAFFLWHGVLPEVPEDLRLDGYRTY